MSTTTSHTAIDPFQKHTAIINKLKVSKTRPTSQMIKDLIDDNNAQTLKYKQLYKEYKGDVAVLGKEIQYDPEKNKPNNKLVNDYRGEIIKQHFSYSFGNPINYMATTDDKGADRLNYELSAMTKLNKIRTLDMKTAKMMGICGTSSRLLYVDKYKIVRIQHVDPWESIFIKDKSLDDIVYAIRYFEIHEYEGDALETKMYVEWYDKNMVYYFIEDGGEFKPYNLEGVTEERHYFDEVPLIEFKNNDERMGDFELVRELIDAYDNAMSCVQDEIDQFRNAYLIFENIGIDTDLLARLRAQGALSIGEGGKVSWLIKEINDTFIENQKNTLDENIYKFSGTVNMSDEKFSGTGQSGESRKWKLKALGDRAIIKQNQFRESIYTQFTCIQTYWNMIGIKFDIINFDIAFTVNIPVDSKYEAETTAILKGHVSERTRLSRLSFVPDVEAELESMEDDQDLIEIPEIKIDEVE